MTEGQEKVPEEQVDESIDIEPFLEKGAKNLKIGECMDFEETGKKIKVCKVNADPNGFEIYERIK